MLPASDLTEIFTNLAALNLQPSTAAAVLGALAPLLRTTETPPPAALEQPARSSRRPRVSKRARPRGAPRRKYTRHAPTEARDRAIAAIKANPDATPTEIAKLANVSRSTAVHARDEIEKEARKQARKAARETMPTTPIGGAKTADPRERAQGFLRERLARGPQRIGDLEEAASKAHIDGRMLEQARADLGVLVSRSNIGVQAVTWRLPAP